MSRAVVIEMEGVHVIVPQPICTTMRSWTPSSIECFRHMRAYGFDRRACASCTVIPRDLRAECQMDVSIAQIYSVAGAPDAYDKDTVACAFRESPKRALVWEWLRENGFLDGRWFWSGDLARVPSLPVSPSYVYVYLQKFHAYALLEHKRAALVEGKRRQVDYYRLNKESDYAASSTA